MADVQLTASIDAAGFNRGINEMKHSLKDLQDTGNMTYDRLDSGFKSVENRLTSTGASVRRLETAFSRYATAMSQDLQMVAGASTQVGQKVDAASQKMAQDMRNLVQAVNQLHAAFTSLLQPVRNIDSQSAQTITQLRNIVNEMRTLNSAVQQTNAQLQNMTSSTTSNTQANNANAASFDKQQSSIRSVKDIMQAVLALGFGSQFAKEVAEATGYMVQLEASFRVLLGSATEARNMMGDLVNFAMKTPFDLKGTADAAKQLLAYGIAAEDVIETERRLGDIGAALGLTMRDLAYLYGTTKTQGRLYALDMRQFTTRGIPMLETLSKQLNVTTADITKMITAGQIGFKEVKNAIWAMTDEGGQFGGLMEEQFNTIKGQLSNLGDAWYQFLAALGKSADIEFGITDNLEDFNDKLMQLAANADIIITTLKNLGTALALMGAAQGVAWLAKTISSMLAFGTVLGSTQVQMAGFSMQTATGTTIAGNFRAAWINAGRSLANFRTIAAATGSTMAAVSTSARLLGTAIGATMPYIGMAMAIYGVVQALRAWYTEVDNSEQASIALAKAASSSDLAISKMYTKLQATSEGTKEHTAAIDKLIGKLVENNIVSQEYCDSLTTEAAKTQLLIDKKNELARIERNKEVRSAGDTQRETIISNRTETFAEDAEEELKNRIDSYMTNRANDHTAAGYDIEELIDKERIDQYVQMYGSTMATVYNEIALAQADYNAKLITEAEYNDKVNTSREGAARAITALANNYAKGAEQAEKLRQRTQDLFDVQTGFQSNGSLFSKDLVDSFKAYVQELVDVETVVNQLTGTHSNPAQEYTSLSRGFSWLQHMTNEGADLNNMVDINGNAVSAMSALASVEELMSKLDEITSDPKMIQIDIEKGALNSLEQFVDHGKEQIQALVDYAKEHPTEFTANIDEIEANMNSIVQKMEADPDHWKEHTTQFTGELTALNNALNSGAEDIERFKKNHGKIDIDFGVILRNNSLKLVESMLEKLKKAFEALGLEDAVKRIDAALTSVRQRVAAVEEKRVKAGNTPGDRLAATRSSYLNSGTAPDLNTYNDYTTQELEARVKDIKSQLKKQKDDERGRKAVDDLNEELDAINAELTQRSPSKSQAAAEKKRKAAEMARREAERKEKEEEKKRKATEALDKLMRKHELALNEAADANILNEYKRRLSELENELNRKKNSVTDERVLAENRARESGRELQTDTNNDGVLDSYLHADELAVFQNEVLEAEEAYNRKLHDLNNEFIKDRLSYIEKYGSSAKKLLALAEDYNSRIAEAERKGRMWEASSLRVEYENKASEIKLEDLKASIDWETVFSNIDRASTKALQSLKEKLQAALSTEGIEPKDAEVLAEKILEIENKIAERNDFWSSLIPALQERVRLTNQVAEAEERISEARKKEEGIRNEIVTHISEATGASEGGVRQQLSTMSRDSSEVLQFYGIDEASEAGQRLAADFARLSAATEKATNAENHKANLEDMLKGGSIGDIFSNAVSSAGGGAMGISNLVNQNSQSMAEMVDKVGLGTTDFGQAVHRFADGVGGFTSAVGALMKGDVFGAINGVLDGVAGFGKMGISIFAGGGNEDEMEAEIAELAEANTKLSESINTLAKEINKSDNTNKESIDYYKQAKLAEEQWEANQRKAIDDRASEYANSGYGFLGLGGRSSFNYLMAGNNWWGWNEFNRVLREHGLAANASRNNIWNLTPEQMQIMRDFAPAAWRELFNGDGHRNPEDLVNDYITHAGKLEELTSSLNEKLTGYSWEGFLDSYKDLLKDLESDTEDFADHINDLVTNALIEAFVNDELKKDIDALYKYIAEASKDGIDETEQRNIDKMNMDIANKSLAWRDSMVAAGRIKTSGEAEQKATSGTFEGMTSDQADALEGRFTAVQGYVARVTEILEDWYKNGVVHRGDYTPAGSHEQVAYSPVVNPTTPEVNVDFTDLQQELRDVKEVMEKTNANLIAFNTNYNTTQVNTAEYLDTLVGRAASLPRQEELLRRMSKDVAEI